MMENKFIPFELTLQLSRLITLWILIAGEVSAQQSDPLERAWPERSPVPVTWPEPVMDNQNFIFMQADRLETGFGDGTESYLWDVQGWMGNDYHKLWLKSEGEGGFNDSIDTAEIQVLYSRLFTPFWDIQLGGRYDVRPEPATAHAVIGLQGLAPFWLEIDAAAFISEKGDISFRTELEYELLLTQRLILQPRIEVNAAAQAIPELALGSGIHNIEMGMRLRYEIKREVAPYIGISLNKYLGKTAENLRDTGGSASELSIILGIRLWY